MYTCVCVHVIVSLWHGYAEGIQQNLLRCLSCYTCRIMIKDLFIYIYIFQSAFWFLIQFIVSSKIVSNKMVFSWSWLLTGSYNNLLLIFSTSFMEFIVNLTTRESTLGRMHEKVSMHITMRALSRGQIMIYFFTSCFGLSSLPPKYPAINSVFTRPCCWTTKLHLILGATSAWVFGAFENI